MQATSGSLASLVAAASPIVDYVLNAAVGVGAEMVALTSVHGGRVGPRPAAARFASGYPALTGVEAIANAIPAFRKAAHTRA